MWSPTQLSWSNCRPKFELWSLSRLFSKKSLSIFIFESLIEGISQKISKVLKRMPTHMCVYVYYIYIYICICVCMYIYIYIFVYIYIYFFVWIYLNMLKHIHSFGDFGTCRSRRASAKLPWPRRASAVWRRLKPGMIAHGLPQRWSSIGWIFP